MFACEQEEGNWVDLFQQHPRNEQQHDCYIAANILVTRPMPMLDGKIIPRTGEGLWSMHFSTPEAAGQANNRRPGFGDDLPPPSYVPGVQKNIS